MTYIPLTQIEQAFKELQGPIPSGAELAGGHLYIVPGSVQGSVELSSNLLNIERFAREPDICPPMPYKGTHGQ
jgi:hypothetical protein